jgi:hypothetical protein
MLQASRRILRLSKKSPSLDGNSNSSTSAISTHLSPEGTRCTERDIPEDVILEIVKYLPNAEILTFCLVVSNSFFKLPSLTEHEYKAKRIHILLVPSLYTSVELRTNQQCRLILKTFSSRPELARFIGRLVVCPNRLCSWPGLVSDKPLKESEIAASLEQLASAGRLNRLHTFRWEGVETPHDGLWRTLKTQCVASDLWNQLTYRIPVAHY